MPWFRAAIGSLVVLSAVTVVFFPGIFGLISWLGPMLERAPPWFLRVFPILQFGVVYAIGWTAARVASARPGSPVAIGLVVALPSVLVGGGLGVMAALRPIHLVITLLGALGLVAACIWGARRRPQA